MLDAVTAWEFKGLTQSPAVSYFRPWDFACSSAMPTSDPVRPSSETEQIWSQAAFFAELVVLICGNTAQDVKVECFE